MNSPISVSDGLWTFTNYGPLTTTFTPVPSCTGPDARRLGNFNNGQVIINYAVQCTNNIGTDDNCWPAPTTTQSPFPTPPNGRYWEGIGGYYSPGLYCPKGWETVGVAARDAGSSLSSSGALSTTTVVETFSRSGTETGFFTEPTGDNAGSMLKGVLEPKQTMAVCCPSSFTADIEGGGCYSIEPSYTPTAACWSDVGLFYENTENTITYTSGTKIITSVSEGPTSTTYKNETRSFTFPSSDASQFTGMVYVAMLTLVHKESDLVSATSAAKATGSKATSNAAVRLGGVRHEEGSNGIVGVVGVVMAAMGLGAAILFQ
ncbi:uncharacterized protein N7473_005643 [Penicillium subrubescens]|uniref:Uncharacterized protein n=1 Tax=Penicillium subrubescens TaxID=1316194 RepID=A0A1Q5T5R3_9EURO|nr:uncharacterized protein N7473_005643 [Penicillium subrubescens]KAJ5896244.1 hypothetical protein N7473_005643 [Penicillium subrubescens]OKO95564.1 hypothetical protein PENSUB_11076 [Penicillium subrubescens]